ncbi:MAG: BamA/TamA family outer membrane protein [Alphaproteobacteria bacterium]|nr:BamA/TamA family outer membrane protein [Alphaproteobacteria bacterium]
MREKIFIVRAVLAVAVSLALWSPAWADDVEDVLRRIPLKGVQPDDTEQAKEIPMPATATMPATRTSAPAVQPFVLKSVAIEGASVFAPEAFRAAYANYLERTVATPELARIAEKITAMYRSGGYFLSRAVIPAQDVTDGHLKIEIIEGYVDQIVIDGNVPELAAYADRLLSERPARIGTLERALYLMGDTAGIRFKSSRMAPDGQDLARHKLIVTAERVAFDANLYTDYRGKPEAGEMQTYLRAGAAHLLSFGDKLSGGYFFVPDQPDELAFGELNYIAALGYDGASLALNGSISRNTRGNNGPNLDNESDSTRFFGQLSYPLIRERETSLWLHGGLQRLHIRDEENGTLSYQDDLAVAHAAATLRQVVGDGLAVVYLEIADGFAKAPDVPHSRADADGRFVKAFAQATMIQPLPWGFGVFVEVDGQVSNRPLFSAMEFALGGSRIGRGYDTGEITGEDGVGGVIELRYFEKLSSWLGAQLYGFYDAGTVWNDNMPAGQDSATLNSTGAGVRLSLPHSVSIGYEAAKPLTRTPAVPGNKDVRHFFSLSWAL